MSRTGKTTTRGQGLRHLTAIVTGLVLLAASCSSGNGGSKSSSSAAAEKQGPKDVLRTPFVADMQDPDPDIFYSAEGVIVTTNVYEGLLQYAPDSTKIIPALAKSWTVSPDGLTYTFTLQSGVKFHDGSPMDSAAVKFSFDRRTKVNGPGAYMLADVASVDSSDPSRVVVKLKKPVSAFLDYMAAPYGPKIVSPSLIKAHEKNGDLGQAYLQTHDAGTGPYTISKFQPGTGYELTRFPAYWGAKPYFSKIEIPIVPDVATQRLQLESGQLDVMMKGLTTTDLEKFQSDPQFRVQEFPNMLKLFLFVNPNKGPFVSQAARDALRNAIDKPRLTKAVFGNFATPSTQYYPKGMIPLSAHTEAYTFNLDQLKQVVSTLSDKKVDLAYDATAAVTNSRMADLIAADLSQTGLNVTTRGVQLDQVFGWPQHPDQAPDLFLLAAVPDAAHPDTWIRLWSYTGSPVNFLNCKSDPQADALIDAGLAATDKQDVIKDYADAADLVVKSGCIISISDISDVFVSRGVQGFDQGHLLAAQQSTLVGPLTAG